MEEPPQPSPQIRASIDVRWPARGVAQVVLGGEHDLSTAVQLRKTLAESLAGCSKLIVDLRDTQFIDSSTIRVLVETRREAETSGRGFNVLLATTPIVERSLEITGVLPILNRVKTLEEALPPGDHALPQD
jgi:anti-anti-sigma factor